MELHEDFKGDASSVRLALQKINKGTIILEREDNQNHLVIVRNYSICGYVGFPIDSKLYQYLFNKVAVSKLDKTINSREFKWELTSELDNLLWDDADERTQEFLNSTRGFTYGELNGFNKPGYFFVGWDHNHLGEKEIDDTFILSPAGIFSTPESVLSEAIAISNAITKLNDSLP